MKQKGQFKPLILEIIEGPENNKGKVLQFNDNGLVGSRRKHYNGFTIFGCEDIGNSKVDNEVLNVDYLFPSQMGMSKNHFYIKYDFCKL